tara:strand:- start:6268 stop:6630 length:363 start_codon:yes stop_codon:yes gene_type:complete
MTQETPAPVAAGAMYTTNADAHAASNDAVPTATANAAAVGAHAFVPKIAVTNRATEVDSARPAANDAACEISASRARTITVIVCSMKNASNPTTVPITKVVTHFATVEVCRPVRRKLCFV